MIKTLLATTGAILFAASALQAAPTGSFGARGTAGGARAQARPSANYSHAYGARYGYRGYRGGYYGHRYYFGGVPFFYDPFFFGFGYGYYGGGFGGAYGDGYGYGPYGPGYNNGAYNGRVADGRNHENDGSQDPMALPKEVQKQLSKRGYYKGSIDGEFGPGSKAALTRFQSDNNLRATGRVDGATLKALGFEDREDRNDSPRN